VKGSVRLLMVLTLLLMGREAAGQTLSGEALVNALRHGGYVLVVRHASSPREAPTRASANADNVNLERQLDDNGRAGAVAMGKALRELKIPVGQVFTSPAYRAAETVRLAQLPNPQPRTELGDGGQSMQGVAQSQLAWLQERVTERRAGTNTILVTHLPNIAGAFPQWASGLLDGETLVVGADSSGAATLVARIKIDQWASRQF
jgi:phosphohistidine phosphatase SixA